MPLAVAALAALAIVVAGAAAASARAAVLSDDFDAGRQGWRVQGASGTALPTWVATGGNPGGYISAADSLVSGTMYWDAPGRYLGDMSDFFGATLAMQMRQSDTTSQFDDPAGDIVLSGGGKTISTQLPAHPGSDWGGFALRLDPSSQPWVVEPADTPAGAQDFVDVLAGVTDFRLRADYRAGADTDDLDSVRLTDGNRVSVAGGTLGFEAGSFHANIVVITDSGGPAFEVRDPTGLLAAGPGCSPVTSVEASCTKAGVTQIEVITHDDKDSVSLVGVDIDAQLDGGPQKDRLEGGLADDLIVGGNAEDRLYGHSGADTLDARDGGPDLVRCGGGAHDVALVDPADPPPSGCETVSR